MSPKVHIIILLAVIAVLCGTPAKLFAQNTTIDSFSKSKQFLRSIHAARPVTFYCGCPFQGKQSDWSGCGFTPRKDAERAARIEWEHVVPASILGRAFTSWTDGHPDCLSKAGKPYKGRRGAEKPAPLYRLMQADMYNLQPAIGEVNGLRSNYPMTIIAGEKRIFGACDVEIERRKFEPPPTIRGDIARTYFYMETAYPGMSVIAAGERKMFRQWDASDPVDAWECQRAERIAEIQGNPNLVLAARCQPDVTAGR